LQRGRPGYRPPVLASYLELQERFKSSPVEPRNPFLADADHWDGELARLPNEFEARIGIFNHVDLSERNAL